MATATGSYATTSDLKTRLGVTDTDDDTLLGTICDQVNQFIESTTGRILAPVSGTPTRTYDIAETTAVLHVPEGIRAITTLEVADYTGADYATVTSGDYFLRPSYPAPAWPYTHVHMSDNPTGTIFSFPKGFDTVRITATFGFAAIPDDITDLALTIAVRSWHAREAGQQDIVGTDEMGRPLVSRFVSGRDRDTLRRYTLAGFLA